MTLRYTFNYLPCQSCTARNHCEKCQAEIAGVLLGLPGVARADVNVPLRALTVEANGADPDDIDDAMDAIGVFLG